ncbi:MAG TPA: glutamate dehydrogenase, partial [Desulfobulbaceae bacterium]|nr:glutamate dehydrogenase [Desulfobulbaceae bacterium]
HVDDSIEGKTCLVSGSGNVAQYTCEKINQLGGRVVTLSDSSGYIYDEEGIDCDKLGFVKQLKNIRRGRIREYCEQYPNAVYTEADAELGYNPLWAHKADCAMPCATQNEINEQDAKNLVQAGVRLVCEGANMPSTPGAIDTFMEEGILYGPGKAANAGGVAVSGLEMAQNSMRLSWPREEVEARLKQIMHSIHTTCIDAAAEYGMDGNYMAGANIAGFVKVVNAMLDQGLV